MTLRHILTIAGLTLHETLRKRLVLAVFILTLGLMGALTWAYSKLATLTDRTGTLLPAVDRLSNEVILTILIAFMFSFVLAIGAAFLAAPTISSDVESGILLAILPRPLRRLDVVVGKWLGLVALLSGYTMATSALTFFLIHLVTGYLPPNPTLAVCFIVTEALVVLTIGTLFSTFLPPLTGGIVALVLFGAAWIAGIGESIGLALGNTALSSAGTVMGLLLPTDQLWRGAIFNMEPAIIVAAEQGFSRNANPFYAVGQPTTAFLVWTALWIVVVISSASLIFTRRDL